MKPQRIQLKRSKGWRMPENAAKVDRTTEYGNPYRVGPSVPITTDKEWAVISDSDLWFFATKREAAEAAVKLFQAYIDLPQNRPLRDRGIFALRGKDIGCWCATDMPCHGDVWLNLANAARKAA